MFISTHANLNEVILLPKLPNKSQSLTNIPVPVMRNLVLSCQGSPYDSQNYICDCCFPWFTHRG